MFFSTVILWKQGIRLKDDTNSALTRRKLSYVTSMKNDFAGVRLVQSGNDAQDGSFATA
jgi:hypothetical protein